MQTILCCHLSVRVRLFNHPHGVADDGENISNYDRLCARDGLDCGCRMDVDRDLWVGRCLVRYAGIRDHIARCSILGAVQDAPP